MKDRKSVTKALADQYRKGSKGDKGRLLDTFVEATGYDRCYARRLLRNHGRRVMVRPGVVVQGDVRVRPRRERPATYGPEVVGPLRKIWEILDYITGKRLKPALAEVVPRLIACHELRVSKAVRDKLLHISPATIDRVLKPYRAQYQLKGRAHTKPGTLLKHQIPIRTFADWEDVRPGFCEMDLVGHEGGRAEGDYCFTLDVTDVATTWTELAAVQNKAQQWVFEALLDIRARLPFPLQGLDSDNGAEFINDHLRRYCAQEQITFTRSRPGRKNDNCFVEQKNWSVARRFVGYARYDTLEVQQHLNELYKLLSNYINFFIPSMKQIPKVGEGTRRRPRFDTAQTPYQRVLASPDVCELDKQRLRERYQPLNPAQLHRQILKCQEELERRVARHNKRQAVA